LKINKKMKKALKRASQRKTGTGGESKLEKLTKEAISFPGDIRGVEKSALDKREYRTFKLENEIEVLLISDSRTEASGAALSVNVGSFSDPEECPGLAHFLEHMLFMGTEKYPDENGYSKYLSENGGYSNAYTADEETNYQFQVMSGKLEHALDMFAQVSGFKKSSSLYIIVPNLTIDNCRVLEHFEYGALIQKNQLIC